MDKKITCVCRKCGIREFDEACACTRPPISRLTISTRMKPRARVCPFSAGVSFISVRTQMRATKDQSHQRIPPTLGTHAAQHGHRGSLWLLKDHHGWGVAYWSVTCSSLTLPCTLRFRITKYSEEINSGMCRNLVEKTRINIYFSLRISRTSYLSFYYLPFYYLSFYYLPFIIVLFTIYL